MSLANLAHEWDVVVVGAGVAGAVTAYRLASGGLRVLLVEKSAWPRDKPCGGCLNAAALAALSRAGLGEVDHEGQGVTQLRLACSDRRATLRLPPGRAVSRRRLDECLVQRARAAGTVFLSSTQAALESGSESGHEPGLDSGHAASRRRRVQLRQEGSSSTVMAKLVIGCDGLGSRLVRNETPGELSVAHDSRIGLGTTLMDAPAAYQPETIHMACAQQGYVGLVRVEAGRLNIGAALDPVWVKRQGGPGAAVAAVLRESNLPCPDGLLDADWHGTPRLTRQRERLGVHRVLVLGDAAGYVEPFTGEGMAWAVAGALAIEPLAHEAVDAWHPGLVERWTRQHARLVRSRQRSCRSVAALLRHPQRLARCLPVLDALPQAAVPLTAWLNRDYRLTAREAR